MARTFFEAATLLSSIISPLDRSHRDGRRSWCVEYQGHAGRLSGWQQSSHTLA